MPRGAVQQVIGLHPVEVGVLATVECARDDVHRAGIGVVLPGDQLLATVDVVLGTVVDDSGPDQAPLDRLFEVPRERLVDERSCLGRDRVLRRGDRRQGLIVGEAYMNGTLSFEDGSHLRDFLNLFSLNRSSFSAHPSWNILL